MVPSSDQCRPRWRAQRGGVVHVVAKAGVCDALEVGGLDRSTKRAACPEAHIVREDQQNIGRASRGLDALWKVGHRTLHGTLDLPLKWRLWSRQYRVGGGIY